MIVACDSQIKFGKLDEMPNPCGLLPFPIRDYGRGFLEVHHNVSAGRGRQEYYSVPIVTLGKQEQGLTYGVSGCRTLVIEK